MQVLIPVNAVSLFLLYRKQIASYSLKLKLAIIKKILV